MLVGAYPVLLMAVHSVGFNPGGGGIPGSLLLRMVLLGGDGVGDD